MIKANKWSDYDVTAGAFLSHSTFNSRAKNYWQREFNLSQSVSSAFVLFKFVFGLSCLPAPSLLCDWDSLSPWVHFTVVWKRFEKVPCASSSSRARVRHYLRRAWRLTVLCTGCSVFKIQTCFKKIQSYKISRGEVTKKALVPWWRIDEHDYE